MIWHWGRRGGGPRYTLEVARALAGLGGVAVHLSFSRQAEIAAEMRSLALPSLEVDTYRGIVEAAAATARLPLLRRRFRRYLHDHRIETVFCTMGHLWNAAVAPAVHEAGARYCLALHDAVAHPGEESRLRAWSLRRELAVTDGVITLTGHVRDQLVALHGYPRDRTWVIPHGAFVFTPGAEPRMLPRGRPLRLLFFGRILPYKGLGLLLDAYAGLRERFRDGIELVVAGTGDLKPHADRLATLPGVTLDNRWIGEDEIGGILAGADLVVAPYVEASQSGVVISAYGAGLPVVATPVGGLKEQVADGETGRLAAAVSAEALAAAIAELATDAGLYARCSEGALRHAGQELSWKPIAERYREVAERLLHPGGF